MKYPLSIVAIYFCFGLARSQNQELKSYKFSSYTLEYPKSWEIRHNPFGFQFYPKHKVKSKERLVFVGVTKDKLKKYIGKTDIIAHLKKYAETPDYHIKNKTFSIIKINDNGKFQYKITSEILFVSSKEMYTREEFIKHDGKYLTTIMYQAKKDLFYKYYDDATLIINSIEKR